MGRVERGPFASISRAVDRALRHEHTLVVSQLGVLDDVLGLAAVAPLLVVLKAFSFDLLLDALVIVAECLEFVLPFGQFFVQPVKCK